MCSGCCLMWLFYRYFYKSSGVICELGSTLPVLLEQGVYGALGVPELFSSEPGGERDKHSLFQTLPTFLELPLHRVLSRSCSSWFSSCAHQNVALSTASAGRASV